MSHPLPYPASRYMSAKLQPWLIRARLAIKRALCNMHTHCSDYVSGLEIVGAGEFCWAPWVTCQKCTKFHLHSILPRLQQLSVFSSLAKAFIASALSHETPLHQLRPASTSDAHRMTTDPLPESWKAWLIWLAQRKEGEGMKERRRLII